MLTALASRAILGLKVNKTTPKDGAPLKRKAVAREIVPKPINFMPEAEFLRVWYQFTSHRQNQMMPAGNSKSICKDRVRTNLNSKANIRNERPLASCRRTKS